MKIDFDHTTGHELANQEAININLEAQLMLIERLKPALSIEDGRFVYSMLDANGEPVFSVHGDTLIQAICAFEGACYNCKLK